MSALFPLHRIGWRKARGLIKTEGYRIAKFKDGHAELIEPEKKKVTFGLHLTPLVSSEGGCATDWLSARSVELLEEALRNDELEVVE